MGAVGWRASAVRGEKAGRFREVAGVTIDVAAGQSAVGTSLNLTPLPSLSTY